jgi:hypothetical protein
MIMKKLIPILLIAVFAFARTAVPAQPALRSAEILVHNINQVEMSVSNFGKFGQTENGAAGCWWPKGSGHNYIFGAGSWFGTIDGSDTLVTIGYGPHGGETEYVAGDQGMSQSDPNAIIFMYPSPWPPPIDGFNTVIPPDKNKSHQDSWCVYNDLDETAHTPGDTRPIGLVVYQTVYAWNLSSTQDIIFIRYELKNVSGADLTNCYFGVCADNDIGNESGAAANDIISGIVGHDYIINGDTIFVDNLGYQWQEDQEPTPPPAWDPGVLGYDYLQSPWDLVEGHDKDLDGIPDQYERDSAYYVNNLADSLWDVDFDGTPDWRDPSEIPQLGMTAFKRFTLNLEPNKDNERYVTLAGYNFKTGVYEPYDTIPPEPDDQRFLQCSGPFTLEADSVATVLVGIIFADWYGIYDWPDTALVRIDNTCQFIYDMNWLLPGPPSPPTLTCIPGDDEVTLVWNSAPEYEPDPYYDVVGTDPTSPLYDPFYKQYDFEGYRVWRSLTGNAGEWDKLVYCDKYNGLVFEDTTAIPHDTLIASDVGLFHAYVDTDVRNGFTYYYAVTSYDNNYVKVDSVSFNIVRFESGLVGVTAAPRRDPANLVPGEYLVELVNGNDSLLGDVAIDITYPLDMTSDVQYLVCGDLDWAWFYSYDSLGAVVDSVVSPEVVGYIEDASRVVVDSVRMVLPLQVPVEASYMYSAFEGLSVTMAYVRDSFPTSESIFDTVEVGGSYPDSIVGPANLGPFAGYFNFWGYRGNDYRVEWATASGGGKTVKVTDVNTGTVIPYRPYLPTSAHDSDTLAHGWCFLANRQASDTIITNGSAPQTLWNTKWLYICGGMIALKNGGHLLPADPLPGNGDEWFVRAREDFHPMAVDAEFRVTPTPAYFDSVTEIAEMNVKVVPNPYLVYNEWQLNFAERRLKFINLPAECTIRVFNLNGELVRTIIHHATTEDGLVVNDAGGDEWWNMLSNMGQLVASGVYVFHVQSDVGEQVGKFVIIR